MISPLLLVLSVCQDPAPAPAATATPPAARQPGNAQAPAPQVARDVVELKNGDVLEGRITAQVDGYVEVEIEAGAVVGVSMAQVAAVRRGAGAAMPPAVSSAFSSGSEWFLLYDGQGTSVGWLHASTSLRASGRVALSEEYEFVEGSRRYQVTSLCEADADGAPRSCYFRERISDPALLLGSLPGADAASLPDRIGDERIVEATCAGDKLLCSRLDHNGRREWQLPWAPQNGFPLLARALARLGRGPVGAARLFDPASEELVDRAFEAPRPRHVQIDGKTLDVLEVAETTAAGRNSVWFDASLHTVRRELAGPTLVAVPSSADAPRSVGGVAIRGALAKEANGRFGLWLPNPAWRAVEDAPVGQVTLLCDAHDAAVALTLLDHLEKEVSLDSAVDSVANWFHLLYPELTDETRSPVQLRERRGVRITANGRKGGLAMQATVDVVPHGDHFLVMICRAPSTSWEELEPDFAFFARTVELDPKSVDPPLQGPLAERAAAHRKGAPTRVRMVDLSSAGAAVPQVPQPPAKKPATRSGSVRVPVDG